MEEKVNNLELKKQRIPSHWGDLGRILREMFLNIIFFFIVFSILIIFFPHSYIAVLLAKIFYCILVYEGLDEKNNHLFQGEWIYS